MCSKFLLGLAAGLVFLQHRTYRRNILFGATVFTLFLVFGGSVFLGDDLARRPIAFLLFWGICLVSALVVIWLAIYDILAIRRDHRVRMDRLEGELEEAASEARRLAEIELEKDSNAEEDHEK
ncbi:MAG: hypothetical protein HKN23_11990 [Verrucomicrobiales bacterium]|nr:hypothetical protein [Verrucomicrobiales bacterium]